MGSKKVSKRKRPYKTGKSQGRLFLPAFLILVSMAIMAAGGWLFTHTSGAGTVSAPEDDTSRTSSSELSRPLSQDVLNQLVGRWRRPDGGYVLEIQSVDYRGILQAAYFNPRPIHVSQARATREQNAMQVFIELNDTGYPGATYTLQFHSQQNVLAGVYYQPAVKQAFDVFFVREN